MSAAVLDRVDPGVALRSMHDAVDDLLAADYTAGSEEELLDTFRELERLRRRLAAVDHALIREANARQLPEQLSIRTVAGLLRALVRLDPREAAGRVRAAEAAGTRRALTGQVLPPAYPAVAAAQAAGEISPRHAAIITTMIEKLPDPARRDHGAEIEDTLVGHARDWDPDCLATLARRVRDHYDPDGPDPDGTDPDDGHRHRSRDFRLTTRADGSARGMFEATAELAELLQTHFDALAAPRPESDGVKDPRTAGQRRHDALLESLKLVLRAELLPTVAGVTTTIVVTMTEQQYRTGTGLARTSHGALIPARDAIRWGGGDLRLLAVVRSRIRPVEAYSRTARLFTENQRLALYAVDGGCTFPHCPAPPGRCQVHHLTAWADAGPTTLDNATLVCRYDHDLRIRQGWTARRINNRTAWVPPLWIDPDQKPRYNHLHQPFQPEDQPLEPLEPEGPDPRPWLPLEPEQPAQEMESQVPL
jgi:hypothetical protein